MAGNTSLKPLLLVCCNWDMLRICNKNKGRDRAGHSVVWSWRSPAVVRGNTLMYLAGLIGLLLRLPPLGRPRWPRVLFICPCRHNSPTVPASHNGCHRLKSPWALRPCQVVHSFFHGDRARCPLSSSISSPVTLLSLTWITVLLAAKWRSNLLTLIEPPSVVQKCREFRTPTS